MIRELIKRAICSSYKYEILYIPARAELHEIELVDKLISKKEFINDIKTAIEKSTGYAAGKIGMSEKRWMYYRYLADTETATIKIKVFEKSLVFHGLKDAGIFPAEPAFYLQYNDFYIKHVRNMDCLGLFHCHPIEIKMETELISFYNLNNKLTYFTNQEPDRSSPADELNCYLQFFEGKKILLICPFARLLRERATKEIFEGVWSKTGKKWFYPRCVDALEFPYGFSDETHKRYSTAIELFKHITADIEKRDFDIALIAAAGLGIPIASFVKDLGKIGISLGGHLQVLFGVIGQRWRDRKEWEEKYFNNWWIDMPAIYKPKETDVCDRGAYW